MEMGELKNIVEVLLFCSETPLSINELQQLLKDNSPSKQTIETILKELSQDFGPRGIELKQLASGYCIQTKAKYSPWVSRLFETRELKYSMAALETLAIIAYRQPVSRGDIEAIRGVSVSSQTIRSFMEREWIEIMGYRDGPGKPALYRTTSKFLDYFNLLSLHDLPPLDIKNESSF